MTLNVNTFFIAAHCLKNEYNIKKGLVISVLHFTLFLYLLNTMRKNHMWTYIDIEKAGFKAARR